MASSRPTFQTELSTDASPWITEADNAPSSNFRSSDVSVDAMPGRRLPRIRPQPQTQSPASVPVKKQEDYSEKQSIKAKTSEEESIAQVTEKIQGLVCSDDSFDSSYNSMSTISDSLLELEEEIKKYEKHMPTYLKAPFIDVLILYADEDREEADKFREHLQNEIILPDGQRIQALLYDCPEFTGLSGSMLQHLDLAVERSTYVFVYLTKSFVNDKWCEISSESCLMKAIYDEEKRWCVVPVYTERRNQCKFKIPMGLNSLKGINYYNNDKFYRDGVARLIGDKVNVKFKMEEDLKVIKKEWIEKYKREQEKQKELLLRAQKIEEEKTRQFEEQLKEETNQWMKEGMIPPSFSENNLYSMHQSSSTNSLKDIQDQNPHVADYFHQLRLQALHQQQARMGLYPVGQQVQQPSIHPYHTPPVGEAAYYSNNQHAVRRSPSQSSALSKDAGYSQPIPQEILNKIKDLPKEDQDKYISFFLETQSLQQQQQAVMNMPPQNQLWQSAYQGHGSPGPGHMFSSQQLGSPGHEVRQTAQTECIDDPLMNAPSLNLSLFGQGQQVSLGNYGNQNVCSHGAGQPLQIPIIVDQSMNSYHQQSVPYNASWGETNISSGGDGSFSTGHGSEGQSMDGLRSNEAGGNMPDSGLFNSNTQPSSLEVDSGSNNDPSSLKSNDCADRMNSEKDTEETKTVEGNSDEQGKLVETKTKREKHVHYTINIYQAEAVQIGDSNIVKQLDGGKSEVLTDDSSDEDDDDGDKPNKDEHNTPAKNRHTYNKQVGEIQPNTNNPEPTTVADGAPSTHPGHSDPGHNPFFPRNRDNFNLETPTKVSGGDKPIGLARPLPRDNKSDDDDDDITKCKQVVPTSQTARKIVHPVVHQDRQSNLNNSSGPYMPNQLAQQLTKSPGNERSENAGSTRNENWSTGPQNGQSPPANPRTFSSSNVSNPQMLFYRPLIRVAPGDDPLRREPSAPTSNLQGESQGFQPNINGPDTDNDNDFDMIEENIDYEGGAFTESVENPVDQGTSQTRRIIENLLNRITNKVK